MHVVGRVFRKHLAESKGVVEQEFGISLGKLGAYPIWQFPVREFRWSNDSGLRDNLDSIMHNAYESLYTLKHPDIDESARAGNRGVYYSDSPLAKDFSEAKARQILFHELYHIALPRYAGHDDICSEDWCTSITDLIDESFAEYMALRIMKKKFNHVEKSHSLEAEVEWLDHELNINKVPDHARSIADFVLKLDGDGYDAIDSYECYTGLRE